MKSGLLSGTMTRERIAAFPRMTFAATSLTFRSPS